MSPSESAPAAPARTPPPPWLRHLDPPGPDAELDQWAGCARCDAPGPQVKVRGLWLCLRCAPVAGLRRSKR